MNQRKELCCIGPNTLAYGSARLRRERSLPKKTDPCAESKTIKNCQIDQ